MVDAPDTPCTYLCGNSLGPLSKRSEALIHAELDVWRHRAVEGHFTAEGEAGNWTKATDRVVPLFAEIVGAKELEVACMGTLTSNLHLLMCSFYKPTKDRYKILCEAKAFPSDQYAFASQAIAHGFDPKDAVLEVSPRPGEFTLRDEDIYDMIEKHGSSIALVLFSGVQYYTGQWFPMEQITRKAKEQGCICGWDLAHAVGNVPLSLHDWNVDFAVWCTYKYLNSGPGGIAGLFVHEKWDDEPPKFAGWWGNVLSSRFKMGSNFERIKGAGGYQQSNPSAIDIASLLGSLQIFKEAGMLAVTRPRSIQLTKELEQLLLASKYHVPLGQHESTTQPGFTILTPSEPERRGAQLSLLFLPVGSGVMQKVFQTLSEYGVIGDKREPDVIRLAPAPLYSSVKDCKNAAKYLELALDSV